MGVIVAIVAIVIIVGALSLSSNSSNEFNTANVLQTERTLEDARQNLDDDSQVKTPGIELSFPPQADECLVELYGLDYNQRLMSGEINPNEAQNAIAECMKGGEEMQLRQTSAVFEAVKQFLYR